MTCLLSKYPILNRSLIILISTLIVACGPADDSDSASNNSEASNNKEPIFYSQDSVHHSALGEAITVDLSDKSVLSSGELLEINDLTILTDNPACQDVQVSGMRLSLGAFSQPGMCQFQYGVKAVANATRYSSERMISQLVVSEHPLRMANSIAYSRALPSASLPPISIPLTSNTQSIIVNIKSQLASLYPQDTDNKDFVLTDTVLVLGNGTATITTDSSITYTPDSSDPGGITRILYSLTDDFDKDGIGDFKLGAIDITVRPGDLNTSPIANNFSWDNNGGSITLGTQYIIDVTNIIDGNCSVENNDGNIATNSCISDPDSDELQLVGIYAYDATVVPTAPTTLDSTKFNVTFNHRGIHDITYYISDHIGGYAIGVMRADIPHNLPPVFDGPEIINLTAGTSKKVTSLSVVDPERKAVKITNISVPSEGSITDRDDANLTFTYTSLTTTAGVIPIKITFTDADGFSTIGDVIFTVNPISTLTPISDRNVTTSVSTEIRINIPDFIDGLAKDSSGTVTEIITISDIFGSQLGTTKIDNTNPNIIIYTPYNNIYGVDDFAFSITTDLGNQLSSDIIITIGAPPPLFIEDIDATENEATGIISASVTCSNCDVTKGYQYSWVINGEEVSADRSFQIKAEERAYKVQLIVEGEDIFGQKATRKEAYDFFKITLGGFDIPADSCDEIYKEYNSINALVAGDGEYWINGARGKYKTQCDMVTFEEAKAQNKQFWGGYTLVWSYSQQANMDYDNGTKGNMNQFSKRVGWSESTWNNGQGLVRTETDEVNYNNVHITKDEATRFGERVTRVNYTSNPSVETIDEDPDGTVSNWLIESTGPVSFIQGQVNHNGHTMAGIYKGYKFENKPRPNSSNTSSNTELYLGDKLIGNSGYYHGSYSWCIGVGSLSSGLAWPDEDIGINNILGFWGYNNHDAADLVYKCKSPTMLAIDGQTALGCYGDYTSSRITLTKHDNINNGEGYVIQWWIK